MLIFWPRSLRPLRPSTWSVVFRQSMGMRKMRKPAAAAEAPMDLTAVDLTGVPEVSVGAEVVLLGAQGDEQITVEQIAKWSGRLVYEVLTSVGVRVPRRHLRSAS